MLHYIKFSSGKLSLKVVSELECKYSTFPECAFIAPITCVKPKPEPLFFDVINGLNNEFLMKSGTPLPLSVISICMGVILFTLPRYFALGDHNE